MTSRLLACLLMLLALVAGCGGAALPSPTPQSVTSVLEALALRGATIRQAISGDAGCPAVTALQGNALRLAVTLEGSDQDQDVYLFRWRRPAHFDQAATEFERCLADYGASNPQIDVHALELSPWRAFGPNWSTELRRVVEESLRAAGGG